MSVGVLSVVVVAVVVVRVILTKLWTKLRTLEGCCQESVLSIDHQTLMAIDWTFASYGKNRRSQGPDVSGLKLYVAILAVCIKFAPNA